MVEGNTEMIRLDEFKVGDKVTWFDDHYANLVDGRKQYGDGPFTVAAVFDRNPHVWRDMGHTQHVCLEGMYSVLHQDELLELSGAFLKIWKGN